MVQTIKSPIQTVKFIHLKEPLRETTPTGGETLKYVSEHLINGERFFNVFGTKYSNHYELSFMKGIGREEANRLVIAGGNKEAFL